MTPSCSEEEEITPSRLQVIATEVKKSSHLRFDQHILKERLCSGDMRGIDVSVNFARAHGADFQQTSL